jgi:predicted DNA-binding protein YlxM (UPF0122 family)
MSEKWREAPGYQSIEVSDKGRVRKNGNLYSPPMGSLGYLRINAEGTQERVHRVVAKAFLEQPRPDAEVNHKNGNKTDNRVENLEWVTKSQNMKHAHKNGLSKSYGEHSSQSKLTAVEAMKVKLLAEDGRLYLSEIAQKFNIGKRHVRRIRDGKRWSHLSERGTDLLDETPEDYCERVWGDFDTSDRKGVSLTERQAERIYELAHNSDMSYRRIGDQFGVSAAMVSRIKNHQAWTQIHC